MVQLIRQLIPSKSQGKDEQMGPQGDSCAEETTAEATVGWRNEPLVVSCLQLLEPWIFVLVEEFQLLILPIGQKKEQLQEKEEGRMAV